jgi:hypothetical protein
MTNDNIRDWNPADGDACQGDVILFRLPDGMRIDRAQPIAPKGHQLILAEGEVTGHHHAIWFNPPMFRDDAMAHAAEATFKAADAEGGRATLYRDDVAIEALIAAGALTTDRLAIGLLVVEDSPVILRHQEHDPIRIPTGVYYVGRQREENAGAEHQVAD